MLSYNLFKFNTDLTMPSFWHCLQNVQSRMYLKVQCSSVCPCMGSQQQTLLQVRCCSLYRLIAAWLVGKCGQCLIVSVCGRATQTCLTMQHTHNCVTPSSRTTRVSLYEKKHSPTQTHPDHQTSFIKCCDPGRPPCLIYVLGSFSPTSPGPLWSSS